MIISLEHRSYSFHQASRFRVTLSFFSAVKVTGSVRFWAIDVYWANIDGCMSSTIISSSAFKDSRNWFVLWALPCFMPRPSGRAVADEGWWPGNARYIQAKVNSLISGTIFFRHSRNPCFPHWKIKQNHWNRNITPQNNSKSHAYFFLTNQIKQNKNPQIQEVKGREKPGEISMVHDICDIISASLSIMDLSPLTPINCIGSSYLLISFHAKIEFFSH